MKNWTKPNLSSALPITPEELLALGITPDADEVRGELVTRGPWGIPVTYRALCMSVAWTPDDTAKYRGERDSVTAYGVRSLSDCHQEGHALEGRVSVNGRRVRGFTSHQLFELPCGKLINVATIHACL